MINCRQKLLMPMMFITIGFIVVLVFCAAGIGRDHRTRENGSAAPTVAAGERGWASSPTLAPESRIKENDVTLTGEAAQAELGENGRFASLGAALAAARHVVEPIDPASPHARGAEYYAANPGQQLRAWFSKDGVELASGIPTPEGEEPWNLALRLRGIGRGGVITPVSAGIPSGEGSRVEVDHSDVGTIQWFDNRKDGVEQGFTVMQPPEGMAGEITLALEVEGNLRAEALDSADGIRLVDSSGVEKVRYDGLSAWDATGRNLDARMEPTGSGYLTISVSDQGAVYPLTIDPLFANVEARLVQSSDGDRLGASVALSGDTALIGVPGAFTAYVFTRTGTTWSQQAQLASVEDGPFGNLVALSGDTALVGPHVFVRSGTVWSMQARLVATDGASLADPVALEGNTALIGAYVFVRSGTVWSQQAKLVPGDGSTLGGPVAFSGATAVASTTPESGNRKVHVFVRSGTVWSQQATLNAYDLLSNNDSYGGTLAISGDNVLVGAPNQTTDILAEGSVYFFRRSGTSWSALNKISGFTDGDGFGSSIAVSADTAVIGGPGFYTQTATIVTRSGSVWSRQRTINGPGGVVESVFGSSVAISGTTVLVGAPGSDTSAGKDAGSAYAFVQNGSTWPQQSDFQIDDAAEDDRNGYSVSISGDTAVVGAIDDGLARTGCAYVFVRRGLIWTSQAKLTRSDGTSNETFGVSAALSGDTAIIGSPGNSSGGSAYVFRRSGAVWNQQAKLTASDGAGPSYFGGSVALSGETALIGASFDGIGGSAYVFLRNGTVWTQQAKLNAPNPEDRDIFGHAVDISGDTALVGVILDDTPAGIDAGSAFVFKRVGSVWNQEAQLTPAAAAPADFFGASVALTGGSFISITTWQNIPIGSRSGSFGIDFRLTPQSSSMNGIVGLAAGAADDSSDLACAVRLNPSGFFDVRNGSAYGAVSQVAYVAGQDYEVAMSVDTASGTYSVSIDGIVVAQDFAFETEQTGVPRFNILALQSATGSHTVSNYTPVTALIGSSGDDTELGTDTGSAYVFTRGASGWSQQARLTAGDADTGDDFGGAVALEGNSALVGASRDDSVAGDGSGSAYVFVRYGTLWNEELKLTSGVDASSGDGFGISVSLSGTTALVGAHYDDTAGSAAGSAYTFLLGELPYITRQPVSRTVVPEQSATFSIEAGGFGPLRYQWRRNGSLISGETGPSLMIASSQVSDQGEYDCVVSNTGGVVTSAPATLSVNALSEFEQSFPAAPPEAQGFVIVTLSPPGIGAGWRFAGEQQWRPPGVPVGGLATGDREIEFRPVPGYNPPPRETVGVVSGGTVTQLDRTYFASGLAGTAGLNVTLKPDAIADAGVPVEDRAQWRFLGEDESAWRDSGTTVANLIPGTYLVECKPVAGRSTPPPVSVILANEAILVPVLTYRLEDVATGLTPGLLPFEVVSTDTNLPYAYVGQIRSDAGAGTGFVVRPKVVATAGHVVFDDGSLSAVTGLQWLFQRDSARFEPEPQVPRGFYLFDGYAAQRTAEGTPGVSSPASQELDAAALYFDSDAGRGGYGGFLASDAASNEWLMSNAQKILAGYPVEDVEASAIGRMHATPASNIVFTAGGSAHTYVTADLYSSGGASGGPLCVQFENGAYFPAGIYLGGTGQSVVRAIDATMIELFDAAQSTAATGDNNTGGGVTLTTITPITVSTNPGVLRGIIEPEAARLTGAGWRLVPETGYRSSDTLKGGLSPGGYVVEFSPVAGFVEPAQVTVEIQGGAETKVTYTYAPLLSEIEQWRLANFEDAANQGDGADDADPDGDGSRNIDEFTAGTDPKDANDVFRILTSVKNLNSFTVTADGKAGRIYTLQRNSGLNGVWTPLNSIGPLDNDGTVSRTDTSIPAGTSFYRLEVSMP